MSIASSAANLAGFDPSLGVHVKGIPLTETSFLAVTNFNQLQAITRHPGDLQPSARITGYDAESIAEESELHALVQRALTGNKKSNVPRYSLYIEEVVNGSRTGVLPPMHLWSQEQLKVFPLGDVQFALIPNGEHILAIDGETQLAAHYELRRRAEPETRDRHGTYPVPAVIHHGIPVEVARQFFHDLNVLAVRPNTSLGLSMNTADPIMATVAKVESRVPFLNGRVDRMARQLTKSSPKVVTMQTLRQMVVNVAKGIAGIQYGARPVPTEGVDLDDVAEVAVAWFSLVFETFRVEASDREVYLFTSSPVLSAIGAMGNLVVNAPRHQRDELQKRLLESLQDVDWRKGERWQGIAGRFSAKGVFTVSGTKEVGYGVFNVLADPHNPNYTTVRDAGHGSSQPSAPSMEQSVQPNVPDSWLLDNE
jgi:DNA sulfur modification protein DndB